MIIIEPNNKIISEILLNKFENPTEKVNTTLAEFDGVMFTLTSEANSPLIQVQMSMKCFRSDLVPVGVESVLGNYYGALYDPSAATDSYDAVLTIDVSSVDVSARDQLIKKVCLFKTVAMSAPFHVAFDAQMKGSQTDLMVINYRQDETMFVKATADRVTVIFSTLFKEETDRIIGKIFLQEFVDIRKLPGLQNGPQVLYMTRSEVPMEVRNVIKNIPDNMNFVTFVLFPRHYQKPEMKEMTIGMIHYFRTYLHYHIKCSKAYMHSRMRAKVDSWLKVLNRAKVENDDKKEKKTASGKTFVRK